MTAVSVITTSPVLQALGWTLLHFFWQGAIVALLLACVLGVLPSNARLRYAAGCAAMALMAALPLITFGILLAKSHPATIHYAMPPAAEGRATLVAGDVGVSTQP